MYENVSRTLGGVGKWIPKEREVDRRLERRVRDEETEGGGGLTHLVDLGNGIPNVRNVEKNHKRRDVCEWEG